MLTQTNEGRKWELDANFRGLWEHAFVTSQGTPHGRFTRAIRRGSLFHAELAAGELGRLNLDDALQLVRLYASEGSPKYERAALRWLERYIVETEPSLQDVAATACSFVEARHK